MITNFRIIIVLILLTFIVYFNSLGNGFVWDDNSFITSNDNFKDVRNIPAYFSSNFCKGIAMVVGCKYFYRPLISLIYLSEYKIWGLNPWGYHLTSVIFHTIVVLLIFQISFFIFKSRSLSFLSALIFAIHPVHVESISFVAALTDPPTAVFMLLSFWTYIIAIQSQKKKNTKWWILFLSLIFFFLALLSKEISVTLPILLLIYGYIYYPKDHRKNIINLLPYLMVFIIYFIMRGNALGWERMEFKIDTLYYRALNIPCLIFGYIKLLLFPVNLSPFRTVPSSLGLLELNVIMPLFLLLMVTLIMIRSYRYSKGLFFFSLWFFITLLPVINIIPMNSPHVTDRFSYIPSIGFSLFMGGIINNFQKYYQIKMKLKTIYISIFSVMIVFYAIGTMNRNNVWKDDFTLWSDTLKRSPDESGVHNNLGLEYLNRGDYDRAIIEFHEALKLVSNDSKIYLNIGLVYQKRGEWDLAIEEYQKALKINPLDYKSYINLGMIYFNTGNMELSIENYQKANKIEPDQSKPFFSIGQVLFKQGKYELSIKEYEDGLRISPDNIDARFYIGISLGNIGMIEEGIKNLKRFLELSSGINTYENQREVALQIIKKVDKKDL